MTQLIIGLDSSTTACKAIVWDTQGNPVAQGRSPIPLEQPHPTWHEQPAEAWWQAAVESLGQVIARVNPRHLAALCISPQRETFVPVDANARPLRKAIVWLDERCGPLLPEIEQQLGAEQVRRQTGKPLSGNLSLGKIAWLKINEPDVFAQTYKYLDVAGYLNYHLTGVFGSGWGCVDPMGLFDMQQQRWSAEILAYLGLTEAQLPEVFPPGTILGHVNASAAKQTGLPHGLPVVAGIGDGQAAGLGTNITHPGWAYLSLGTSIILGTLAHSYQPRPAYRVMYGGSANTYMLETVILGGAYTINWFVQKMAQSVGQHVKPNTPLEPVFEKAAQLITPGAEGLLLVPYWNSVMNPYWDAAASGIVVGWRGHHTLAHLYRAILEGIAFELRLHVAGLETAGENNIERFVAVGGGTQSSLWGQIIADITAKPVYRSTTSDASALGAAILAAYGVGLFASIESAAEAMTHLDPVPFTPDQVRHKFYAQLYEEVYVHLFPALQPYLKNLARMTSH
jgi:xylulokinase